MKKLKYSFVLLLAMFFSVAAFAQEPLPGSAIPTTIFYNRDNSVFSTQQIPGGKKSLIMFFDATCGHCQQVASQMNKRHKELANVNIYLVSQDEYRSIDYFTNTFAKELVKQKNVKVVQDRDHVFIMAFHPKQYPALYLYGPDKKLIFTSSKDTDVPKFFKLINP